MDGPAMAGGGGGGAIASAYVEIGGDLAGLRAAEQEAKEIFARISAMGGGSVGGGSNPNVGAGMATPVGGGVSMQIKIDEANIHQQIDAAIRSYAPQPIKIPIEFVQPTGTPFAGTTGQVAGAGATVGPASQGALQAVQNLTGRPEIAPAAVAEQTYGIVGEVNGVNDLTRSAVFAGQQDPREAGRRARGVSGYGGPPTGREAYTVERRPGRIGQTFAMAGGRFMQGLEEAATGEVLESEAEQFARYQSFLRNPNDLAGDEESGQPAAQRGLRQRAAQRQQRAFGNQLARRIAISALVGGVTQMVGDFFGNAEQFEIAQAEGSTGEQLASTRLQQIESNRRGGFAGENILFAKGFEWVADKMGINPFGLFTAGREERDATIGELNAYRNRRLLEGNQIERIGIEGSIASAGIVNPTERQVSEIRTRASVDVIRERQRYAEEIDRMNDVDDPTREGRQNLARMRDNSVSLIERNRDAQIAAVVRDNSSATRARGTIAAGEIESINARLGGNTEASIQAQVRSQQQAFDITAPQNFDLSTDEGQQAAMLVRAQIGARGREEIENFRLQQRRAVETTGVNILSARQRIAGDVHAASLTEIVGNAEVQARATRDPLQAALIRANAQSQAQLYEYNYRRDYNAEGFSLDARSRIAGDIIADHPTAGAAESAVARARLEYDRMTREYPTIHGTRPKSDVNYELQYVGMDDEGLIYEDPRLKQGRETLARELEARRHELIGQHGGELAITMSASAAFAHRPGLDLTEHTADVAAAAGVLGQGIRDVRNGRAIAPNPITGGSGGTSPEQVLTDAKQAIVAFMAAVTKLAAAKGVALFQN